jgi:segregation and condensation protein B
LQKLLDKELVHIIGRSQALGRPLLYGTSQKFMEYFGLNDLSELPALKDFKLIENQIGEDEDRPVQE